MEGMERLDFLRKGELTKLNSSRYKMANYFLKKLLEDYPFQPYTALPKSIELSALCKYNFEHPILDLGCGDGLASSVVFRDRDYIDFGCDISGKDINKARRHNIYCNLSVADITSLPCSPCFFLTVFSISTLEHIQNLNTALKEVNRVLKTNGRFIFTAPSEKFQDFLYYYQKFLKIGKIDKAKSYLKSINKRLAHYHYYGPIKWEKVLREAGLRLINYEYILSKKNEELWNKMETFFTKIIMGKKIYEWIKRTPGISFLFRRILSKTIFMWYLKRWIKFEENTKEQGGLLLIVAEKIV